MGRVCKFRQPHAITVGTTAPAAAGAVPVSFGKGPSDHRKSPCYSASPSASGSILANSAKAKTGPSDHCDHCGGIWCPATAALAGVESSQTRRHGRLRARRLQPGSDNIMLQKLGHVKRSASAEIGIRDTSSKDEL